MMGRVKSPKQLDFKALWFFIIEQLFYHFFQIFGQQIMIRQQPTILNNTEYAIRRRR
jgi:hypothetical protein